MRPVYHAEKQILPHSSVFESLCGSRVIYPHPSPAGMGGSCNGSHEQSQYPDLQPRPFSHTNPHEPLGSGTAGEQASLRARAAGPVVDSNVLTGKSPHISRGSAEWGRLTMESTAMMEGSEREAGTETWGKGCRGSALRYLGAELDTDRNKAEGQKDTTENEA